MTEGVAIGPSLTLSSACMSAPAEGMLAMRSTAMDRRLLLSAGAVRYTCKVDNPVGRVRAARSSADSRRTAVILQRGGAWHLQLPTWQCAMQLRGRQPAQQPLVPVAVCMHCAVHLKEGKNTSLCPANHLYMRSLALAQDSTLFHRCLAHITQGELKLP